MTATTKRVYGKFEVFCSTCETLILRNNHAIQKRKKHFCDRACWAKDQHAPRKAQTETCHCPHCSRDLPKEEFTWYVPKKGKKKGRQIRKGYCRACTSSTLKEYQSTHKDQARARHAAWRSKSLAAGNDDALRWYFARHISSYRKRSKDNGYPPCDLDVVWLTELFRKQEGKCFYTQVPLIWDTYGVGKGNNKFNAMSLDRVDSRGGYTKSNVVLCTWAVNLTKRALSDTEFYALCELVLAVRNARTSQGV